MKTVAQNIDEYIADFPPETQKALELIRKTIIQQVPHAEEKISYAMPTFKIGKSYLVHFAAFKNHIGLYPVPVNEEAFKEDFLPYKIGKGSIQFPLNKPMPLNLIVKILKFRLQKMKES